MYGLKRTYGAIWWKLLVINIILIKTNWKFSSEKLSKYQSTSKKSNFVFIVVCEHYLNN